jgi:hypothetical protein
LARAGAAATAMTETMATTIGRIDGFFTLMTDLLKTT